MLRLSVAAAGVLAASAAVPADKVTNLPNFGAPVSDMYSGYLDAGKGKHLHYVYTASLANPATDPVVLWFNGGPGCSSLEGGFSESGLYRIQEYSNPPTLALNNFSWGTVTNNIFMEAPAGVGFSYCDTAAGCQHTDTAQAVDNLAAMKDFFSKFPELQKNDFWITGESYAGIYIPTLAQQIILDNAKKPAVPINLKGVLVGNGCIGDQAGHCGNDPTGLNDYHDVQTWRGHGLISETSYDAITKACDWPNESAKCQQELQSAANSIGDIDIYYLYNTCDDPVMRRGAPVPEGSMLARVQKARRDRRIARGEDPLSVDPNCYATAGTLEAYMNLAEVKTALHVQPAITYALCSNNGTFQYSPNIADERKTVYPTLIGKITTVIYNGEADLCVPFTDNEWWTRTMNLTVKSPWATWSVPGEEGPYVGGYLISYEKDFHFATVRGAGHMVPETRSEASLAMMSAFVLGK